jgi:hypothetical protein
VLQHGGAAETDNTGGIAIGREAQADRRYWNGDIDEVRVYDTALSGQQIKRLYFYGNDGTFNGTYKSKTTNVPSDSQISQIQVDSNVPTSTSAHVWVNHSSGQSDSVTLDSGTNNKNYSLSFTGTGGTANITVKMDSTDKTATSVINKMRLWSKLQ